MSERAVLTVERKGSVARIEATRVCFSGAQCLAFDGGAEDGRAIDAVIARLRLKPGLAFYGGGKVFDLIAARAPDLVAGAVGIVLDAGAPAPETSLPRFASGALPDTVKTVFLCETRAAERLMQRQRLPRSVEILCLDMLPEIAPEAVPARAWVGATRNIYPIALPEIAFETGLDMLVVDCPARNLALMPNGLGYVHNALKKSGIRFQTFDLDIVAYHRFHIARIFDHGGRVTLPSGKTLPVDPWQAEHYDQWADAEVVGHFKPIIDEAAAAIVRARPKILGLSVQQCNEAMSRHLVNTVRAALPEIVVVVGGFSCYNADIGLRGFPEADYMCIGESDLSVGPLVRALARGERPRNVPGVVSRHDDPKIPFAPAPMPHNLSDLPAPKYDWFSLDIYRNYNDYQLTPIIASRGCRWSRCTFCAERFYWRIRDTKEFVDELEWLVEQGCTLFMFNESDLNGMPELLLKICEEIIRRDLNIKLTGQLRIHKKSDRAFFDTLRKAGFVALRFGVDAFAENTLRLQKKGYTTDMVSQNLKDCWEAGIYTEVNWVIGVPGETEADVDEGIALILKNRDYIGRLANFNPLILVNGSVYWIDPKAHDIVFHEPQEQLYARFPRAIPADLWHSENPYIDAQVRKRRFERIVIALYEAGFPVGPWAQRVIDDVRTARDRNRAGGTAAADADAPAAESGAAPGAAGGEAPPTLVRALETHNVVTWRNRYYGVPKALGSIDLDTVDATALDGVVVDTDLDALVTRIEDARRWANTRGQYEARDDQRRRGSLMRVDSALGEAAVPAPPPRPVVVRFADEWYAIEPETFAGLVGDRPLPQPAESDALAAKTAPSSLLRRAFNALPERLRAEIRRTAIARRAGAAPADLRSSDAGLVAPLVAGTVRRLLRGRAAAAPAASAPAAQPTAEFRILRSVSKDAVPELLRVVANYNVVKFDAKYYGIPHGQMVDWNTDDLAAIPGMIVDRSAKAVVDAIAARTGWTRAKIAEEVPRGRVTGPAENFAATPEPLGAFQGYSLVAYEGFVYGIPAHYGALDLSEVDAVMLPDIIRDVSRDVVENEIAERRARAAAAATAAE